jgi:thioredoxin reductase (NADPH)
MNDFDVVVIGAGPAGLTAGLYLNRAGHRVSVIDKGSPGGQVWNIPWVENYPGFANGISGAQLASDMVAQAEQHGVVARKAEVAGIELYTNSRWVQFSDGRGLTASVIIIAGGCRLKKLGVPGEEELWGKGVSTCAVCDGRLFANRSVAVCGEGDYGISEALYMATLASHVVLIEEMPALTTSKIYQERALNKANLEIRCGTRIEAIVGNDLVEAIEVLDIEKGERSKLDVSGVFIHAGLQPNTDYIRDILPLDGRDRIVVNERMETEIPCILAAGDIRSCSAGQIATAVGDGAIAAISADVLLKKLE